MQNQNFCAPNIENLTYLNNHYTCFTKNELLSIIYALNEYTINQTSKLTNFDSLINLNGIETVEELWNKIYNALKHICHYEHCWIDLDYINNIHDKKLREKIKFFTFKPKFYNHYKNNIKLSNIDIDNVMNQYEKKYKNFYYIGALPCDFYLNEKSSLFKKLKKYDTIGVILNNDTHDQPGSHWTSLFINNKKHEIYFFDSLGEKPNKFIKNFVKMYLSYHKNHFDVYINKHKHQNQNTECGVYSMYFLIKKLDNSFDNNTNLSDKKMSKYRKQLFIF